MANKIQKLTQSRATVQRILNESDGLRQQVESELATLKGGGEGSISAAVESGVRRVLGGASEAYDTLKEIEEYIEKDEAGAVALAQSIAKIPFVCDAYGKGAIQKNGNNTPLMGYYFKAVNSGSRRIILSSKQGYTGETAKENIICQYEVGDVISVAGAWDEVDRDCSTITEIHTGYIVVDNIPTVYDDEVLSHMSYSIFVQKKPHIGLSCLVEGTVAIGSDNVAQNDNTTMVGSGLKTTNSGEMAVGRYNHSYPETTMGSGDGTEFSWGVGNAVARKNLFEVIEGKVYLLGIGGYKGNNAIGSKDITCLNSFLDITYAGLKQLRNDGSLIPGRLYRITDYITTTTQANTQSAGHPFDVIVLALNENTLSERAWAIQSERDADGYFSNSKLEAWQIWYCLDNDTERFAWADTANGKGVIYRMIDEFGNDCPYDFKNIRFKHPNDTETYPDFYYTFSTVISGVVGDHSLNGEYCYGNKIGLRITTIKQQLNNIVFINSSKTSDCYSNSFGNDCHSNSFGNTCYCNIFGDRCFSNSFGNSCHLNSFDNGCYSNSFGRNCRSNSFGNSCHLNSFGNSCYTNSFGRNCSSNSFGNYCYSNSFGNSCYTNSFGNYCRYNHLDDGVSVTLSNIQTASSNQQVQNYHLTQGLTGKTIEVERNRAYQTTVAIDSSGNVKQFCIADIFDAIEQITIKEE